MKKLALLLLLIVCVSGKGIGQQYFTTNLLFNWSDTTLPGSSVFNNTYNEVWGIVDGGKEYAIIGSTMGTHIFDVDNPSAAYMADFIPGRAQGGVIIHRDYHDYMGYLYVVADEGASSLQIIDLSFLPDSVLVVYDSDSLIKTSHNIFIDTVTARLYACGVRDGAGNYDKLVIYSLTNPISPAKMATWNIAGVHDIFVRNDTAYINAGMNGLYIVDFTIPTAPVQLDLLSTYADQGYNHSGWLNDDGTVYAFADETKDMKIKICDVSDPTNIIVHPNLIGSDVHPDSSMAHNLIFRDSLLYVSYYHDGLQVFDLANPKQPVKVASYDTYSPGDHYSYRGAWGVYPLLPSGIVLISDMQYGLFVFDFSLVTRIPMQERAELSVFPNPFDDMFSIEFDPRLSGDLEIRLYNVLGEEVYQAKIKYAEKINIDGLHQLTNGIYYLSIMDENSSYMNKLVKTN